MKIKYLLFLLISVGVLTISSCAKPIDRSLIQVAEDKFPPEVIELTPESDSLYYSVITVEGLVEDHSLLGGDGEGKLVSIAYSISNNPYRRGKIVLEDNGNVLKDSEFGNGDIIYSADTGQFSFSFSTIEFEKVEADGTTRIIENVIHGYITINIDFEDANGNIVREQIGLIENTEPYVKLEEPGTEIVNYEADDNIEIYGNLANSAIDIDENDEILTLEWMLTQMPTWRQKIDLTVLTPEADGRYEVISTEDAIGSPVFTYYPDGVTGSSLPGDPEDEGYFYSVFVAPSIEGNLSFRFITTDKRGGEVTENVEISSRLLSPVFSSISYSGSGVFYNNTENKYYYSSSIISAGDVVFNGRLSDNGDIPQVLYKVRTNGTWLSEKVGYSSTLTTGSTFNFNVDLGDLTTSPGYYSQVRIEANNGSGTGYASKIIYDDHLSPLITVNDFSSSNSNTTYAGLGDTISLVFNVADVGGLSGISGLNGSPVVTIAGHSVTGVNLVDNGGGNWTASYIMGTLSDTALDDLTIPYSITISDNVGNEKIETNSGTEITYYESNPVISSISASTDSPTSENPEWIKAGENIELNYTVIRDLSSTPDVTVSGKSATTTGGPVYNSDYILLSTDNDDSGNGVELTYSISVTDKAGNSSNSSGNTNIWFDKTSPSAPSGLSSNDLSGSYISSLISDFDIDVDMSGSGAKTGDTIELLLGGSSFGSGYNDILNSGELSAYEFATVTRSDLGVDGSKTFTARVIDIAGNVGSECSSFVKYLDTSPPSITINSYSPDYSDNARIRQTGADTITVVATITDANGISGIPTIEFGSESAKNMNNTSGDIWEYSWSISSSFIEDVNYQVKINAEDLVGNTVVKNGRTFILDNVPPVTPNISSTEITNGYVNGEPAQSSFDIKVDYTSANIGDAVELAGLSGTYNHTLVSGETSTYSFTVNRSDLGLDGAKAITAKLTDIAGNVGSDSSSFNITLDTADPVTPTLSSTEITNGYVNGEVDHSTFDIKVDYTSADIGDVVELAGLGGTYIHTLVSGETSTYTFTVNRSDLGADGSKSISGKLTDIAGNIGSNSSSFNITLDTVDPSISLSYSTPDTRISETIIDEVTISATISDTNGISGTPTISIASGAAENMENSWNYDWTVPDGSGADGSYSIEIVAEDNAGNTNSTAGRTFIVDNTVPVTPTISSTEITNGYVNGESGHSTFDIKVDYTSADIGDVVELAGLSSSYSHTLVSGETSTYSFNVNRDHLGSDGAKSITAGLIDIAGNIGSYSSGFNITLDTVKPLAPATPSSTEISGTYINNSFENTDFDITVDLSGTNASEGDTLELLLNDISAIIDHELLSGETSSYTFDTVTRASLGSDGSKGFTARVIDVAGNIGDASVTSLDKVLDTVDPSVSLSYSTPDTRISDAFIDTVTISATITDANGISGTPTISIASGTAQDMENSWDYEWDVPSSSGDDGSYSIDIVAVDNAGNIANVSGRTFIVDNTDPSGYSVAAFVYTTYPFVSFSVSSITEVSPQIKVTYIIRTDGSGPGESLITDTSIFINNTGSYVSPDINISSLDDGVLSCSVIIEDLAGNTGTEETSGTTLPKPQL